MTASTLTPLTNTESSPRAKLASPSFEPNYSSIESNGLYTNRGNITPQPTPPAASHRRSARPPDLEPKGTKCTYDPDLDRKTPRDKKRKPIHENFGDKPEDNVAPRDPRQSVSGYRHGFSGKAKAKLRSSPYVFKYWQHESVPSSPAPLANQPSAVVVTGFDPMTPLAQITALFSSFGEISDLDHKSDPVTGRFLGICVITYQDCPSFQGGGPVTAQLGAKTAFLEGKRGQRVGLKTVKIELEREDLSKRLVEAAISRHRRESGFTTAPKTSLPPPPIERPPQPSGFAKVEGPPPTAPKGPGGKGSARGSAASTAIPQNSLTLQNKAPERKRERDERATGPHVIEEDPIAETLKNTPYIFIADEHVPVLTSTIGHLKKRLRMYDWKDIRADKTGYFLVFEPSRAGQTEAKKTYHGAHMHPLFTYVMHMDVNINGVIQPAMAPVDGAQPTPGVPATPYDLLTQKQRFVAQREREYDLEIEKRQRAQDLDPCRAVVQLVVQELREKLIEDVKSRLAAPLLYEYLDPDRHVDKRRRLGIEDPSESKRQSVADVFGMRRPGKSVNVLALPKIGKKSTIERGTGFRDERRKALPPRPQVRSLFHQLSQFNDEEDSDDEGKTTVTRDTEDVESRPASRMSMTSASSDDEELIKKVQKRRLHHAREESEMGAEYILHRERA